MSRVTIKGVDSLTRRLDNIAEMDILPAVQKATQLVHGQAKSLAPADTGLLRESIHMSVKNKTNSIEGRVYTNTEYAAYVEFGTGESGNGSYPYEVEGLNLAYKDGWGGMAAQPYMYPALHQHKKTIETMLKQGVHSTLKKNCKGD
jgi:HK97 gp10 family phage protein